MSLRELQTVGEPGVVVVGGSVAAVRVCQALRRRGYDGRLTLVSDEEHLPYDRPPLSKDLLAPDHDGSPVPLLTDETVASLEIELRLSTRALGLDPAARTLRVGTPEGVASIDYDRLVIATGASARRLPETSDIDGVHVIRTLEDTQQLRAGLQAGLRAVVVGAGFIGAEFASAAVAHKLDVTVVELLAAPMSHLFGLEVGAALGAAHVAHGARLITGRRVVDVLADRCGDRRVVRAVVLDDGTELPSDLVVIGVGAIPATEWLSDSGLPVPDGVDCDADLGVLGFPGIYAAGDVARWKHCWYDDPLRLEHWTTAGDHAEIIAAHLTGAERPKPVAPYVWSDQYGRRIQIVGRPSVGECVSTSGTLADGDLVAVYADAGGRAVGAVVVDNPRLFLALRKAITARSDAEQVVGALPARVSA